jgi:hypothetical protein
MNRDTDFRRTCLKAEYEDTFREEKKLKEQELRLMQRRKLLANQLINQEEVEAPLLNML